MKILVITFSISNGGDFLIERCMNNLIKETWKDYEVDTINGIKHIETELFNRYNLIIAGGGPYYDNRVIREIWLPLFSDINNIIPPIHILGSGIYGWDCFACAVNRKRFDEDIIDFLRQIEKKNGSFGCRDVLSYIVMKNNGFKNVYMTGCPAWYNFKFLDSTSVDNYPRKINKIVISDPGVTKEVEKQEIIARQAIEVFKKVKQLFPEAEISFTFNNGINTKYSHVCNNIINDYLKKNKIAVYELDYDADKFSVYNDADMHIGFRVHSHIYCLSRRIPSILIEEDLRGFGMNETLGLPHLLSYDEICMHENSIYKCNDFLTKQLEDIIEYFITTHYSRYNGVFYIMKDTYYNGFLNWARQIEKSI